jgi:uracil-DNA glycosylase family 4
VLGSSHGAGLDGGLMLIGEGPGAREEEEGKPFVGKSGQFLQFILKQLRVTNYYLTNAVACRSCAPVFDSLGRPILGRDGNQRISDEAPTPVQAEACRPRLLEQIYIVDPILIISLGGAAAATLTGKSISVKERGTFKQVEVPGVWCNAVFTEKKKQWIRKVGGKLVAPTEQNHVSYLAMLTVHPSFALRFVKDKREKNNFSVFWQDIQTAVHVYNRYLCEVTGQEQENIQLNPDEVEEYAAEL